MQQANDHYLLQCHEKKFSVTGKNTLSDFTAFNESCCDVFRPVKACRRINYFSYKFRQSVVYSGMKAFGLVLFAIAHGEQWQIKPRASLFNVNTFG